jgi:MFS family permease
MKRRPVVDGPNRRRILLLTCTGHFLAHFYILIFPALAVPVMKDTGLALDQVFRLSFFMYLMYGVCALPAGLLADRWSSRRILVVATLGMGASGVAASFAASHGAFAVSLALMGIFASAYHPAGLALISKGIRDRGHALGINGIFGNLGIALAPFVTGLLTYAFGWRWAYGLTGGLGILAGLAFLPLRIREELPDGLRAEAADAASPTSGSGEGAFAPEVEKGPARKGESGGFSRHFALLCLALMLGGLAYRAHTLVLPAYLEMRADFLETFLTRLSRLPYEGTGTLASTILASGTYLVGILGQYVGGRLADRHDLRTLYLAFHLVTLPFLLLIATQTGVPLFLAAAAYAFFGLGMQPIENSLVAYFTPSRRRSAGYGIKFVLNFGVGSVAVYLVGWLENLFQLPAVYFFNAVVASLLVATVLVLILRTRGLSVRNV